MTEGAVLWDGVLQATKNSRLPRRREFFHACGVMTAARTPTVKGHETNGDGWNVARRPRLQVRFRPSSPMPEAVLHERPENGIGGAASQAAPPFRQEKGAQ